MNIFLHRLLDSNFFLIKRKKLIFVLRNLFTSTVKLAFLSNTTFFFSTRSSDCRLLFPEQNSVQFSHSAVSDSLRPHGLQHARPPCPSPTPGVYSNSYPLICHCLLLLPSIFPSIRVFSNESALHIRWPEYQSFSFNISSSNEHTGLISFRMD